MTTGNQSQRLSMITLTVLGLVCLALLPTTDSKSLCPAQLHVLELFLTGNKENFINAVRNFASDNETIDTARKFKSCVDSTLKPQDQNVTFGFVEYLSEDVC
uniref:Major allergen I polypeptide chain 1-like isoform X2 n=1 Tax=Phascolarctos cinereus TaxID=38626 RepID=A0A6P5K6N2_PHACI|nr:major allergen I polypeptide chain 1-like isoform X2 [Phascolarctos cinereus]